MAFCVFDIKFEYVRATVEGKAFNELRLHYCSLQKAGVWEDFEYSK